VSVAISNGPDTEAQFTIRDFKSDNDTVWLGYVFAKIGTRVVTASVHFQGKNGDSQSRVVTIVGKPISAAISPKQASVDEDSTITFDVNVLGTGPISYQWYHNDTAISTGGTSQAYTILSAKILNAGTFRCRVKDQWGDSAFSDTAILAVVPKPNPKLIVSYDGNGNTGGNIPIDSSTYDSGAVVTVKGNSGTLVRTGYNFAGWNTSAGGSGTKYVGDDTFSLGKSNVILYAMWTVAPSSAKTLTGFNLVSPPATGTINETAKTIAISVPYGTASTSLVAAFTTTGASVEVGSVTQVSSTTANNFTSPVTYTVTAEDGSSQDYVVTVTVAANSAKALTGFSFTSLSAIGTINEAAKTVAVTIPFGTTVTALVANFTTTGASVKVGSTAQVSGTTANNFANPLTYTVTAGDGSTQDYIVTVTVSANSAKALTAFSFTSPTATGTINESAKTVAVNVPFGTSVTALVASFTTTGASVKVGPTTQVSGTTANNFTSPLTYTITAADGSTQAYVVTVPIGANSAKALTGFSFTSPSVTGSINESAKTVAVTVPFGTNVTALVASFTITGTSAKVGSAVQASGTTANNFNSPVTYTITASDGSTQGYVVTVTVALNTAKALTVFSFTTPSATGTINESAKTIAVTVPYGTALTALVAAFTTTGASVKVGTATQTSATTPNNFTSPLTYTVTAGDGSTQDYVVTVTVGLSNAKSLTAFSFASPSATGTVNELAKTVTVTLPFGTNVTALVATFATSGASVKVGSVAQTSASTPSNFTNPVTYTVTAADGSTQDYVVTVTVTAPYNYAVTFDGQSATVAANPSSKNVVQPAITVGTLPADPSKTGYRFDGWFTAQNGGGTQFTASTTVTASLVVYAKWTPVYTVTYDGNNKTSGTIPSDNNSYPQSASVPISTNSGNLGRTGYSFSGWNTQPDGSGTSYAAGGSMNMGTSNVILYAKWTPVFTVTYYGNNPGGGGAVPVDNNTYASGTQVTVLDNTGGNPLTRTGWTFAGKWNSNSALTGTDYNAGSHFNITANVSLYAKWTATVSFDAGSNVTTAPNPASISITTPTTTVGTLPSNPAKTSYVFDGWYTGANGTGSAFTASTAVTQSLTVYAKWSIKDMDGNVYSEVNINGQIWMVQNLKTTQLNDGTALTNQTDDTKWAHELDYCWPNASISNKDPYGALYTWDVVNTGKLAPAGWRVANDDDWTALSDYLGGSSLAGGPMRATGTTYWWGPNSDATNSSGFTAVGAGDRNLYLDGSFQEFKSSENWWSSTDPGGSGPTASAVRIDATSANFTGGASYKTVGFSVRCIRTW